MLATTKLLLTKRWNTIFLQLFGVKLLIQEMDMQKEAIPQHGVCWSK